MQRWKKATSKIDGERGVDFATGTGEIEDDQSPRRADREE